MKKKYDIGLILSLGLIIAVGSYWFIKEVPVSGVDYYIDLLGDRLMALVPQENEKEELAGIYEQFKSQVKENKIDPEKVEYVASAIINLSNAKDTLSLKEALAVLNLSTAFDKKTLQEVRDRKTQEKAWEKLKQRLAGVYTLENAVNQYGEQSAKYTYRVDDNLNVIMDSDVQKQVENAEWLKQLEKEKQLIMIPDYESKINLELKKLDEELKIFHQEKSRHRKEKIRIEILNQIARGPKVVLANPPEIVSTINIRLDSTLVDLSDSLRH